MYIPHITDIGLIARISFFSIQNKKDSMANNINQQANPSDSVDALLASVEFWIWE